MGLSAILRRHGYVPFWLSQSRSEMGDEEMQNRGKTNKESNIRREDLGLGSHMLDSGHQI